MEGLIPTWAYGIYIDNKDKIPLKNRMYGLEKECFAIELMKWQQLIIDFDDDTIQCMQGQIVAEIMGLAHTQLVNIYFHILGNMILLLILIAIVQI